MNAGDNLNELDVDYTPFSPGKHQIRVLIILLFSFYFLLISSFSFSINRFYGLENLLKCLI